MTRLSTVLAASAVAMAAATLVLIALTWSVPADLMSGSDLVDAMLTVAFLGEVVLGWLVVRQRHGNRVGWILLAAGLSLLTWAFSARYAVYGLVQEPGSVPGARAAAWVSEWTVALGFGLAFPVLFVTFPDGRLPSHRWRPLGWFVAVSLAVVTIGWATDPGPLSGFEMVSNPVGIDVGFDLAGLGWGMLAVSVVLSVWALAHRLRHSSGVERIQLKWFTFGAVIVGVAFVALTISSAGGAGVVGGLALWIGVAGVPAATAVAIFRFGLYDIDVVVSRTLAYGALALLITGVYIGVVAGVGALIGSVGDASIALSIVATAVVAIVFQPLRLRLVRLADRVVFGERATPYEVLARFGQGLGSAESTDDVLPRMARLLAEGTGAVSADVKLMIGGSLRVVATWPPQSADTGPALVSAVPVRKNGAVLGELAVSTAPGRSMTPIESRLLADLAGHAGLALSNVQLVEELKASRQRIVSAQDEARRRLERDIHDGVQQRLVSLTIALRMSRAMVGRDPDAVVAVSLDNAATEVQQTLSDLRELTHGLHPEILDQGGLGPALQSLAERSPVPTRVSGTPPGRLSPPVEMTAYFVVSEALANASKHASASRICVAVEHVDGWLRLEVTDDGVGGARADVERGSGLAGLADRVAAVSGTFDVESPVGRGTTVRVELPSASS